MDDSLIESFKWMTLSQKKNWRSSRINSCLRDHHVNKKDFCRFFRLVYSTSNHKRKLGSRYSTNSNPEVDLSEGVTELIGFELKKEITEDCIEYRYEDRDKVARVQFPNTRQMGARNSLFVTGPFLITTENAKVGNWPYLTMADNPKRAVLREEGCKKVKIGELEFRII
jgi:hypothetical protein